MERGRIVLGFTPQKASTHPSASVVEAASIVLSEPPEPVTVWIHVSYVNYSTFHFAGLRLCEDMALLGYPSLQDHPVLQVGVHSEAASGPCCSLETDVDFISSLDLQHAWVVSVHIISDQEEHWQKVDTSCCVLPLLECPSSLGLVTGGSRFLLWQGAKYEAHAREAIDRKRTQPTRRGGTAVKVSEANAKSEQGPKRRRRSKGPEFRSHIPDPDAGPPIPDSDAVPSDHLAGHVAQPDMPTQDKDFDFLDPYGAEPDDEHEEAAARAAAQDADGQGLLDVGVTDLTGADFSETKMFFSDLDLGYFLDAEKNELSDDPEEGGDDAASEFSMLYEPSEPGEDLFEAVLRLSAYEAEKSGQQSLAAGEAEAGAAGAEHDLAQHGEVEDSEARAAAARAPGAKTKATSSARRSDFSKVEVSVPGFGKLRFYPHLQELQAVCDHPDHSDCRMSRTTRPFPKAVKPQSTRYGQGRPVGLLTCWLRAQYDHTNQQSHLHSFVHTSEARREARGWLFERLSAEDASTLRSIERNLRDGESEEPDKIS